MHGVSLSAFGVYHFLEQLEKPLLLGHLGCVVFYVGVSMLPTPKKEKKQ
jgi:hypothetical protein